MFELEVAVFAPDEARRAAAPKKKPAVRKAKRGRGAPGKPKSAAHRKAISASMKKYWGSKRAAARRRKGGKRRSGGSKAAAPKATRKTRRKSTGKPATPTPATASTGAKTARAAAKPLKDKSTTKQPARGGNKKLAAIRAQYGRPKKAKK